MFGYARKYRELKLEFDRLSGRYNELMHDLKYVTIPELCDYQTKYHKELRRSSVIEAAYIELRSELDAINEKREADMEVTELEKEALEASFEAGKLSVRMMLLSYRVVLGDEKVSIDDVIRLMDGTLKSKGE